MGTNRAVLSVVRMSECEDNGRGHDVLIPEAGVRGLAKALDNRTGPVQLIAGARGYVVELPGGDRWGGVTERNAFPEYERVVRDPTTFSTQVRTEAQAMTDALRAASLGQNKMVEVTAEPGRVTLKGIDTESGETERTIEFESEVLGQAMPERENARQVWVRCKALQMLLGGQKEGKLRLWIDEPARHFQVEVEDEDGTRRTRIASGARRP